MVGARTGRPSLRALPEYRNEHQGGEEGEEVEEEACHLFLVVVLGSGGRFRRSLLNSRGG